MELDYLDPMSSSMWSRLPNELLINVIHQTTDQETLSAWYEAVQHNYLMHQAAMQAKWRTVTIDDRDLLPAPGEDEERFHKVQTMLRERNLGQHWKPAGEFIRTLLTPSTKSGSCPANHVEHLIFDFRMLRYWTTDIQSSGLAVLKIMPTLTSLQHTLDILKDQFHRLRYASSYGDCPQPILEFVAIENLSICKLDIRGLGSYGSLSNDFNIEPSRSRILRSKRRIHPPLQWKALSLLENLTFLSIHQLLRTEITGLLAIMPGMTKLRSLTLVCTRQDHSCLKHRSSCSLEVMLDQILGAHTEQEMESVMREPGGLPPNLTSLSLIDAKTFEKPVKPLYKRSPLWSNHLVNLNVDLANTGWIPIVLDCLPKMTLNVLSIPGHRSGHDPELYNDHAYMDYAITTQQESLDRVRVLRAWDTDRCWIDGLDEHWQDKFAVQELVLGTRNQAFYCSTLAEWQRRSPEPKLINSLCGFERHNQPCGTRWGDGLRRVRIDHVDITDLDASVLSEPSYSSVKILMLQPGSLRSQARSRVNLANKSICTDLAKHILTHAAPSLCVLVIDTHWYWINGSLPGQDAILWTWADARDDSTQNELMVSTLNKHDLDFLDCTNVPLWGERSSYEWNANLCSPRMPYRPSGEMLHQWNYLTLLPLTDKTRN